MKNHCTKNEEILNGKLHFLCSDILRDHILITLAVMRDVCVIYCLIFWVYVINFCIYFCIEESVLYVLYFIANTKKYLQSYWLRGVQYWPYLYSVFNICTLSLNKKKQKIQSSISVAGNRIAFIKNKLIVNHYPKIICIYN